MPQQDDDATELNHCQAPTFWSRCYESFGVHAARYTISSSCRGGVDGDEHDRQEEISTKEVDLTTTGRASAVGRALFKVVKSQSWFSFPGSAWGRAA